MREAGVCKGGAVGIDVVRSALGRFPLVTDLVNLLSWPTHACVWLGPTRPGLICFMLRPGMACHPGADVPFFFWSQVTNGLSGFCTGLVGVSTWLVDLVVSWADQVSNDCGVRCCAGQHTHVCGWNAGTLWSGFVVHLFLNCACPDLVRKLA